MREQKRRTISFGGNGEDYRTPGRKTEPTEARGKSTREAQKTWGREKISVKGKKNSLGGYFRARRRGEKKSLLEGKARVEKVSPTVCLLLSWGSGKGRRVQRGGGGFLFGGA